MTGPTWMEGCFSNHRKQNCFCPIILPRQVNLHILTTSICIFFYSPILCSSSWFFVFPSASQPLTESSIPNSCSIFGMQRSKKSTWFTYIFISTLQWSWFLRLGFNWTLRQLPMTPTAQTTSSDDKLPGATSAIFTGDKLLVCPTPISWGL